MLRRMAKDVVKITWDCILSGPQEAASIIYTSLELSSEAKTS
jgi:hypothetical protein